ncbi:MAG TPA: porin [Gemmatimonadales bacterium]|jgi:phosphate-selective porin|nr:porin [Gemmatimonadales bacterium]
MRPPTLWCTLALAAAPAAAQSSDSARAAPVRLSGYLQVRETYQARRGLSASINRARLTAGGGFPVGVTWRIQAEFRTGAPGSDGSSVSLKDAVIRFARRGWGVQAGQFKTPFAREFITSLADIETADRSTVVDSLAPQRDIGLMADYGFRELATISVGAFNGEGQNVTSNADSTVLGVARVVVRPLAAVSVGANVARYFGDSTRFGMDASYEDRRAVARAEWLAQTRDRLDAPEDDGWYALAGYFVVPTVQLVGKYERFAREAVGPETRNRAWTAAANIYPWRRAIRVTLEYISRTTGEPGRRRGTGLAQVQARF